MSKRLQLKRVLTLLGLLGLAFAGLGYRLVDLQVLRHDELAGKASKTPSASFGGRRAAATFSTRTAIARHEHFCENGLCRPGLDWKSAGRGCAARSRRCCK